jgi:hypothetical protein
VAGAGRQAVPGIQTLAGCAVFPRFDMSGHQYASGTGRGGVQPAEGASLAPVAEHIQGERMLPRPVETMNSSTPSASLSPREAAYSSAAARWVIGSRHCDQMTCGSCRGLTWPGSTETSGRLRTLPVRSPHVRQRPQSSPRGRSDTSTLSPCPAEIRLLARPPFGRLSSFLTERTVVRHSEPGACSTRAWPAERCPLCAEGTRTRTLCRGRRHPVTWPRAGGSRHIRLSRRKC